MMPQDKTALAQLILATANKYNRKLLGVITGLHTVLLGCFCLPIGYIYADLKWGYETVSKGLGELFQMGFVTHNFSNNWVFIHRIVESNLIDRLNQGKNIRRLLEQIPSKSIFFNDLMTILQSQDKHLEEPFRNGLQTLSEPFRNQEQEQDVGGARSRFQTVTSTVTSTVTPTVTQTVSEITLSKTAVPLIFTTLNDNTEFSISPQQVDEWQWLYFAVDVLQALRNIQGRIPPIPTAAKHVAVFCRISCHGLTKNKTRAGVFEKINTLRTARFTHAIGQRLTIGSINPRIP